MANGYALPTRSGSAIEGRPDSLKSSPAARQDTAVTITVILFASQASGSAGTGAPAVIRDFSRSNQQVDFQIRSDLSVNVAHLVDAGELDVAFITGTKGVSGIRLVEEPLSWIAAPDAAVPFEDPLPLALFPPGCRLRELATAALDESGRWWRIAHSSNEFAPLRSAILVGGAIGVLPARAVPHDLRVVGVEHGLPELPTAEPVIKLAAQVVRHGAATGRRHRTGTSARCGRRGLIRAMQEPFTMWLFADVISVWGRKGEERKSSLG